MEITMTPQHGRDLTVGSTPRQLVSFSLPMLAGVMFFMAYSFVNAIWVGQYLGKAALAAVTVNLPILVPTMVFGLAISTLAGQNIGANKPQRVREIQGEIQGQVTDFYSH